MWVGAMFFPFPCANDCESEIIKADTGLLPFLRWAAFPSAPEV